MTKLIREGTPRTGGGGPSQHKGKPQGLVTVRADRPHRTCDGGQTQVKVDSSFLSLPLSPTLPAPPPSHDQMAVIEGPRHKLRPTAPARCPFRTPTNPCLQTAPAPGRLDGHTQVPDSVSPDRSPLSRGEKQGIYCGPYLHSVRTAGPWGAGVRAGWPGLDKKMEVGDVA